MIPTMKIDKNCNCDLWGRVQNVFFFWYATYCVKRSYIKLLQNHTAKYMDLNKGLWIYWLFDALHIMINGRSLQRGDCSVHPARAGGSRTLLFIGRDPYKTRGKYIYIKKGLLSQQSFSLFFLCVAVFSFFL